MSTKIEITYLYHSGFLVKLDDIYLLFDYYMGELPKFPNDSRIYVFVSHRHKDHFNPEIFKLQDKHNVRYFLSYDIKLNAYGMRKYGITDKCMEYIVPIRFGEDINIDSLRIRAFKSTDSGVAYLASINGKHFYHAGDLNWWHWEEEGNCYNNNMAANYKREIDKLADAEKNIDIAFVPLDPRLGDSYYYGLNYFCETVDAPVIFPMHFWEDYDCQKRFVNEHGYSERI